MPDTETVLRALMRFGIDKAGIGDALKTVSDFRSEIQKAAQDTQDLEEKLSKATPDSEEYAKFAQQLEVARNKVIGLASSVDDQLTRSIAQAERSTRNLYKGVQSLSQLSGIFNDLGSGIGLTNQIQAYQQQQQAAGGSEKSALALAAATDQASDAQVRLGRVAAQYQAPILQAQADMLNNIAALAEKNPGLVQAGVQIGSVLTTLATIGNAISGGIRMYADIKMITATTTQMAAAVAMNAAADKQLAAAGIMASGEGINKFGGVGVAQYGPAVAGASGLAAIGAAIAPMLAVAAAALAVGKAFSMLNDEVIQPMQNLQSVMQAHADQVLKTAGSYQEYQTEVQRVNGLSAIQTRVLTQAEYDQAKAEQGQANAALDAATASQKLTENLILFSKGANVVVDDLAKAKQLFAGMGTIGVSTPAGKALLDQAKGTLAENNPAVQAYVAYRKAVNDAEQQYGAQRTQMVDDQLKAMNEATQTYTDNMKMQLRNFNRQQADALNSFNQSQLKSAIDFTQQQEKSEKDYYAQRLRSAAQFGLETVRLEEDHQIQMRRASEDHGRAIKRLADSRDALGIEDEQENYEIQRRRAEEDYNLSMGRRNQDYAQQMADQEKAFADQRDQAVENYNKQKQDAIDNFNQQRAKAASDFALQQKDQKDAFDAQQKKTADQNKLTLDALDTQYQAESTQRQTDFNDRLSEIDANLTNEKNTRLAYYAVMATDLDSYLQSMHNSFTTNLPGFNPTPNPILPGPWENKAIGGYVQDKAYRLHANEFVVDAPTTKMLERAIGGRLSQEGLAQFGNRSVSNRSQVVNLSMPLSISGAQADPETYRAIAYQAFVDVFEKVNA